MIFNEEKELFIGSFSDGILDIKVGLQGLFSVDIVSDVVSRVSVSSFVVNICAFIISGLTTH